MPPPDLLQYAKDLFHKPLPELLPLDLTIDRIHRISKPSFLPVEVPRDVFMRVHFFLTKEQILRKSRSMGKLPNPYANIQIYADRFKLTLDLRRQLNTITKTLRNNNITYKWKHPTKLSIECKGSSFTITSLEKRPFTARGNGASYLSRPLKLELPPILTKYMPRGLNPTRPRNRWPQLYMVLLHLATHSLPLWPISCYASCAWTVSPHPGKCSLLSSLKAA